MKKFDQALAELQAVQCDAEGLALVRKALGNKSNYMVAKAAQKAEQFGQKVMVPELAKAFQRFFELPDPQCWAKMHSPRH